jgi:ribosomal protein L39E
MIMGAIKHMPKKLRLIKASKKVGAPRWADLKKYGKRARSRRIRVAKTKHWRRGRLQL